MQIPEGLCATEGVDVELATAELQHPVLLLEDGDSEEEEDGWCWSRHWATAKPAREGGRTYTKASGGNTTASSPPRRRRSGAAGRREGQRGGKPSLAATGQGRCRASQTFLSFCFWEGATAASEDSGLRVTSFSPGKCQELLPSPLRQQKAPDAG